MLGIDKETFIKAIQNSDVKIFTSEDMEDLFYDLGEECQYNKNGELEFVNQDKSVNAEIKKEVKSLRFTKQDILNGIGTRIPEQKVHRFGPGIICYECGKVDTCNERCERYLHYKKEYEEWLNKIDQLGHTPIEPTIYKN